MGYSPGDRRESDTTEHKAHVVHVHPQLPNYPFPISFPPATVSSFSESLFCNFIGIISFYIPHIRDVI